MIFLSGQVPVALDGKAPETLAGLAHQVYANITTILALPGALPSSIIKLTTFLTEHDDSADCVRQARAKYLGEYRPASTAWFVSRLVDRSRKTEIHAAVLVP
jgi:2-iminobutanoate/2-iminopropanoate deaminase